MIAIEFELKIAIVFDVERNWFEKKNAKTQNRNENVKWSIRISEISIVEIRWLKKKMFSWLISIFFFHNERDLNWR